MLADLEDLGVETVVLDTIPDDPADRLATEEEWRMLERVVSARGRGHADSR